MSELVNKANLDAAFEKFDSDNPQVWRLFERFTFEAIASGRDRYSAEAILQRIRWHVEIETRADDGFKVNNNHRARYARKFVAAYPEHRRFFQLRGDAKSAERERTTIPEVDRSRVTMVDGSPVTVDHRELDPRTGMQRGYVVLTEEERRRGFVRPVRRTYRHDRCGSTTTMAPAIAETYARDPKFYGGTFCCGCARHFPVAEFRWDGTDEAVGS